MLTPEQEKLFEENKNLIHETIKRYVTNAGAYGINDYDDLFQIGSIGLCKAIKSYNPNNEKKAKFSTYAVFVIRNQLYNAYRDCNSKVEEDSVSLTDEFVELNVDLAYNNINSMYDDMLMKEGLELIDKCAEKYTGIAKKGAEAIKLSLLGYSCNDIAQMYNVETKLLTAWMSRSRKKLQREPALIRLLNAE
jgi:RNA polymerase sigma factor (sigma-70 family)